MEIPEELVEEMADYLQASYAMGQHDYKLGLGYGKTPRKWDKNSAKKIISRILKAVVDGELDEVLEVVGRSPVIGALGPGWVKIEKHLWRKVRDGGYLIALSPFPRDPLGTGTGKGEE